MSEGNTKRRVVVTGCGLVSPLGDGVSEVFDALWQGEKAFREVESFAAQHAQASHAAALDFAPRRYLPEGNLRPLDRTGQLATSAAQLALDAAALPREEREARLAGLVLGTLYGSVHTISAFDHRALEAGPKYVKPFDFANSVINAAAGQVGIWHGLPGINSTLTGGATAGGQALGYAFDAIRDGRAEVVLAGGAEELCFESWLAFLRGGWLAGSTNGAAPLPVPYAVGGNGFALGEGAALLVLEEAEAARSRGAVAIAEVRGHASVYDVSRGADAQTAAHAVERAVNLALQEAEAKPEDVALVSVGAAGHPTLDLAEAHGLTQALGRNDVPILAIKGQLGECLGAAGAIQAAVLVECLLRGEVPGIAGLTEVAPEVPLEGLHVAGRSLGTSPRLGLVTAVGLDGNVNALLLEAVEDSSS